MHELSICQALIGQLEELAARESARQVARVQLGIGPLSGVEPQLLSQAYPVAAAGSVAQDAQLDIRPQPVRVHCPECGRDSEVSANRLLCTHCGNWRTQLLSGDELILMQVEFIRETEHV